MVNTQGQEGRLGVIRKAWWSLYGVAFTISLTVSAEAFASISDTIMKTVIYIYNTQKYQVDQHSFCISSRFHATDCP